MKEAHLSKIIFIFALILLGQQLWVPGFFHDGYLYAALGKNAAEASHWLVPHLSDSAYARFSHHPPLYFMIEGVFFKLFGSDWTQARLFGILWVLLWLYGMRRVLLKKTTLEVANLFVLLLIVMPDVLKKARFPNLDFALAAMCGIALLIVWKESRTYKWALAGVLLGLGFWFKGLALLVFGAVFLTYLIFERLERLHFKTSRPYLCAVLTLAIGALWPLLLKLTGNWDIFTGYLDMQFTHTAIEGRGESMPFYTYIVHVATTMPHLILLALWGLYKERAQYFKNDLTRLGAIWFFTGLILLSCMKFKYSHYLIPYYPGLALLALPGLMAIKKRYAPQFGRALTLLTVTAGLMLLIFPFTTKNRRHPELVQMEQALEWRQLAPEEFILLDGAYEFWSTTNYVAYRFDRPVRAIGMNELVVKSPVVVLTDPSQEAQIAANYKSTLLFRNHRVSIHYLTP